MKKIIIKSLLILILTVFSCKSQVAEIAGSISEVYTDTWKFHTGEGKDSLWMNTDYNDSGWIDVVSSKLLKDQNVSLDNASENFKPSIKMDLKSLNELFNSEATTKKIELLKKYII